MRKTLGALIFATLSPAVSAVNISETGYGEAVIMPYYTVNNNLNTLLTLNNTTEDVKAVKVHFREGKEGKAVLTFNLYLAPHDIWNGALLPFASTIPGHQGESSAMFYTADTSCAPFLNKTGQQFLPYEIDAESMDTNLERSTEGFIEFIEMGVVDPESDLWEAAMFANGADSPNACLELEDEFVQGAWDGDVDTLKNDFMLPATGGISAEASVIDVAEGVLFSIDGTAFENFYAAGSTYHTQPGNTRVPSLADADTTSMIIHDGEILNSEWSEGYQAISALLSKYQVETFYDIEPAVAGKSEVVLSFPTKRFYANDEAPFGVGSVNGCFAYEKTTIDRNTQQQTDSSDFQLCNNINTLQHVLSPGQSNQQPTSILGAKFFANRDIQSSVSGKLQLTFMQESVSNNEEVYTGMPVIAMSFLKYTNAGAAPGLLAQYGGSSKARFKRNISTN